MVFWGVRINSLCVLYSTTCNVGDNSLVLFCKENEILCLIKTRVFYLESFVASSHKDCFVPLPITAQWRRSMYIGSKMGIAWVQKSVPLWKLQSYLDGAQSCGVFRTLCLPLAPRAGMTSLAGTLKVGHWKCAKAPEQQLELLVIDQFLDSLYSTVRNRMKEKFLDFSNALSLLTSRIYAQ